MRKPDRHVTQDYLNMLSFSTSEELLCIMNWSKAAEARLAEHCSPGKGCELMIKITIIRQQWRFFRQEGTQRDQENNTL